MIQDYQERQGGLLTQEGLAFLDHPVLLLVLLFLEIPFLPSLPLNLSDQVVLEVLYLLLTLWDQVGLKQ